MVPTKTVAIDFVVRRDYDASFSKDRSLLYPAHPRGLPQLVVDLSPFSLSICHFKFLSLSIHKEK